MSIIDFFSNSKFFKISEFDSRNEPKSGLKMDVIFMQMLERARVLAAISFVINRGYSSESHNHDIGGIDGSEHTKGTAVDIKALDSATRYIIVDALLKAGFNQIGIYPHHVHVHLNPKKPNPVLFLGSYKVKK